MGGASEARGRYVAVATSLCEVKGVKGVPGKGARYVWVRQHRETGGRGRAEGEGDGEATGSASAGFPEERCLFVGGLPVGATEASVARFFAFFGAVERVVVSRLGKGEGAGAGPADFLASALGPARAAEVGREVPWADVVRRKGAARGGGGGGGGDEEEGLGSAASPGDAAPAVAHVVFQSAKGLRKVLKQGEGGGAGARVAAADMDVLPGVADGGAAAWGMKRWLGAHLGERPESKRLRRTVDGHMARFNSEEAAEERRREAMAHGEDEDGWTLVVSGKGRHVGSKAGETAVHAVKQAKAESVGLIQKERQEKEVLLDFYRFQKRERRRQELLVLRERFEQDKKKVAELVAQRKFQPH